MKLESLNIIYLFKFQVKQAFASMKNKPDFVFSVVSTMGLTLGALLSVLTLAYVMLVKPLPYPDQERLYKVDNVQFDATGSANVTAFNYPGLVHFYQNQQSFSDSALMLFDEEVLTSMALQPTLTTTYITPQWFTLLAVDMALGRAFEQSEALNTHNPVAVISYETWQNEFSADKNILEQKVTFRGVSFSIIGVIAPSFVEPEIEQLGRKSQILLPWDFNATPQRFRERWWDRGNSLTFIGKLKNELTAKQAEQQITTLVNDTWQDNIDRQGFYKGWHIEMQLRSFKSVILGDNENKAYLTLIGVIGLLLIACINISNLQLSRTVEKQNLLAIMAAVGAKRKHIFQALFTESLLLMTLAMVLALVVAQFAFSLMQSQLQLVLPRVNELNLGGFTLICALLFPLVLAFFFAALSQRVVNYQRLNTNLQSSGKGTGLQVSKFVRQILIISQVTVATVLIFINISLFNEAITSINQEEGFNVDNLISLSIAPSTSTELSRADQLAISKEIQQKIAQLPQVELVSKNSSPLTDSEGTWSLTEVQSNQIVLPLGKSVDSHYFNLMGQDFIAGDNFGENDYKDRAPVLVINQVLAQQLTQQLNKQESIKALGKQLSFGGPNAYTIIGVVNDFKLPGKNTIPPRVYMPNLSRSNLLIKLKDQQTISRAQLVAVIKEVTSSVSLFEFSPLSKQKSHRLFTQYTTAITTAALTLITFILSAIGLYGILSYSTQMRRFEIGTRMAIGAKRRDLIALIIKDNASSIILGIVTSIFILSVLTFGFSEQLEHYLTLQLLPMFLATSGLVSFISLFACYLPLRQYINRPAIYSLRGAE